MGSAPADDELIAELRSAGCVFAEEEAAELRRWAAHDFQLESWVRRRVAGEPLEHIVGHVDFCGLTLRVGRGVFVPRQRSALLARAALDSLTERAPDAVLVEACCGVAPIAAVVADRFPRVRSVVTDVDGPAAELAAHNVPSARVVVGNGLAALPRELRRGVDVIAAVPPYVPDSAVGLLPVEASEYEPRRALLGGPDGLAVVRQLLAKAPAWLGQRGVILLEMHRDQLPAASESALRAGLRPGSVSGEDGHTVVLVARVGG
ncbi:MAG: SAM-dependent methyltransferase [Gordonia sp. (in: high G+C Gram-positive bacteria)]